MNKNVTDNYKKLDIMAVCKFLYKIIILPFKYKKITDLNYLKRFIRDTKELMCKQ